MSDAPILKDVFELLRWLDRNFEMSANPGAEDYLPESDSGKSIGDLEHDYRTQVIRAMSEYRSIGKTLTEACSRFAELIVNEVGGRIDWSRKWRIYTRERITHSISEGESSNRVHLSAYFIIAPPIGDSGD